MKSPKIQVIAVTLALMGIIFFSAKAVIVKLAYQYEISAVPLLLLRMAFSLPVYLIIALIKRPFKPEEITKKDYLWLLTFGFIGYYLASLFDFMGLQYIKASLERIILFIYPTLVLFITWIFFKKIPTRVQVLAIIVTYIGIFITFGEELGVENSGEVLLGGFLVFLSALTYAFYLVGSGYLIPKFGAVTFTSYAMIVSCVCVVLHYSFTSTDDILAYPKEVYALGFLMAMISTVIPSYLISFAIKHMGASNFSILGSMGPISTIILANIFLDERLTYMQILGAVVVIGGILLVTTATGGKKAQAAMPGKTEKSATT
ncbi:Permease of the drug/metabolite transporter (DMT) superfamily [Fulvivirga imtechensis AK7]|uniref:Permease of the drug/metabolite transporter (DMT) superfamily n=1 Tax=Fulvivirga imtechensis AK7 TaxID=1237149 RepID=L8JNZ5_9BACT|nr:DMT family transporter [Fulvivirga imtechensis]ELR69224.1 Permease of the drug/metabolite transporter (DMT) superfamily [Fulvivirga imtechensis AK7]